MFRIACGRLDRNGWGIAPRDFWAMTPWEWWRLYDINIGGEQAEKAETLDRLHSLLDKERGIN